MQLNLKKLLSDKFVRGTFILTVMTFLSAVLNYLVHPILTRRLSIPEYGDYQALLSFLTILGIIGSVVLTALTKEFSVLSVTAPDEIKSLRRRAAQYLFWLGLILFALVLVGSGPLNDLFKISHPAALLLTALSLLYTFPLFVNRALLTGRQHFPALSLSNFLDAASRLLLVILLVVFWPLGLIGAALALGLSSLIALALSFWQIKSVGLPADSRPFSGSLTALGGYVLLVLWFTALSQFFYNFDMLFVKSLFSPETAGLYGALLTIGRIVYFIGGAIPLAMFPIIANLKTDQSLRRHAVLGKSLALTSAIALPAALVIALWPSFVIKILVGAKYLSIAPYLPLFTLVILLLTLLMVLAQYFLALGQRRSLVILTVAALAEIGGLLLFHQTIWQVIDTLGLVFGLASVALLALFAADYRLTKKNLYATPD
jgi:O-antigen/teichoic acid export membrane protein